MGSSRIAARVDTLFDERGAGGVPRLKFRINLIPLISYASIRLVM
jgi:hypothetical protein